MLYLRKGIRVRSIVSTHIPHTPSSIVLFISGIELEKRLLIKPI